MAQTPATPYDGGNVNVTQPVVTRPMQQLGTLSTAVTAISSQIYQLKTQDVGPTVKPGAPINIVRRLIAPNTWQFKVSTLRRAQDSTFQSTQILLQTSNGTQALQGLITDGKGVTFTQQRSFVSAAAVIQQTDTRGNVSNTAFGVGSSRALVLL